MRVLRAKQLCEGFLGNEECGRALEVVVLAEGESGELLDGGLGKDLVRLVVCEEKEGSEGANGEFGVNGGWNERGEEGLVGGGEGDGGNGD